MKSIRNFLFAALLSLLLAGVTWLEAHAPREERIVVLPSPTPVPISQSLFLEINTPELEELDQPPRMAGATAVPATEPPSCSDGAVGSGIFVWPADNHTLTGNDYGPGHPGIDIAAGEGSPVYAADAGVVIALGNDEAIYGNVIQIDHHNGYMTVYAHLSVIGVSMCQGVQAGQWIGEAGSTGNARGAHLHFEVAQDGWAIDPWTVLP